MAPIRLLSFTIALALIASFDCRGQSAPGSPYTYFGIGDIYPKGFGQQLMVAGSGLADRDHYTLNNTNPASYSAIDHPYSGLFETGFSAAWAGGLSDNKSTDADLPFLALGFKTGQKSAASIGIRQYSNIKYYITGTTTFSGLQSEYNIHYKGSGGLNDLYFGYGRRVSKNLSVGIHGSYLFGQATHTQHVWDNSPDYTLSIEDFSFMRTFNFEMGSQYTISLAKSDLTVGLTYSPAASLREDRDVTISNNLTSSYTDTLTADNLEPYGFSIPHSIGAGLVFNLRNKVKFYSDGQYQLWTKTGVKTGDYQLTNSYRLSAGIRTLADYSSFTFWKRMEFGFGLYGERSYVKIKDEPIRSFGVTAGLDLPVRNNAKVRLIYENGTELTKSGSYFTDNYSRVTLSITILDRWFQKVKYD